MPLYSLEDIETRRFGDFTEQPDSTAWIMLQQDQAAERMEPTRPVIDDLASGNFSTDEDLPYGHTVHECFSAHLLNAAPSHGRTPRWY